MHRLKFLCFTAFCAAVTTVSGCNDVTDKSNEDMEKLELTTEWDKVFPQSDKVDHSKITFHNRYGVTLAADLYIPKNASGKLPAIAMSGPYGAVKEQVSGLYAQTLAERGFLTIAFDPSFTGESGGQPRAVSSPDINTEDFCAAVDYLSTREDVDPERIGVLGDSAGGYLVQMMGATNGEKEWDRGDFLQENSDVQAVVSFYGISDLRSIGEGLGQDKIHSSPAVTEALLVHGPAFKEFAGASILSDDAKAIGASPIGHVDGSEPPFLLLHGSADKVVSPLQSVHMYEALKAAKSDVEYVLVRGAGHGDLPWYQPAVIARVVNFFSTKLGMRKTVSEDASNNL